MRCFQAKQLLIGYQHGELEEPRAGRLRKHLACCSRCRARLAELEALDGVLSESSEALPSLSPNPALWERLEAQLERENLPHTKARWWMNTGRLRLAAVMACAATLTVIFAAQIGHDPLESPNSMAPRLSQPAQVPQALERQIGIPSKVKAPTQTKHVMSAPEAHPGSTPMAVISPSLSKERPIGAHTEKAPARMTESPASMKRAQMRLMSAPPSTPAAAAAVPRDSTPLQIPSQNKISAGKAAGTPDIQTDLSRMPGASYRSAPEARDQQTQRPRATSAKRSAPILMCLASDGDGLTVRALDSHATTKSPIRLAAKYRNGDGGPIMPSGYWRVAITHIGEETKGAPQTRMLSPKQPSSADRAGLLSSRATEAKDASECWQGEFDLRDADFTWKPGRYQIQIELQDKNDHWISSNPVEITVE